MLDFLGDRESNESLKKAAAAIETAVIKTVREKLKSLAAGKMGYGTKEVGDLVAAAI
jgi:3-isopropylmalate dehydrogenase